MFITEFFKKRKFCIKADRIGPDIPFTHWRLHFSSLMLKLCKKKFKYFANTATIRPGAYVIGCSNIHIGNRVVIRPGCMFFAESNKKETSITIEDDVMLGSGVHIYINNHRFDDIKIPFIDQGYYESQPVVIKAGTWIGANVIILPGVTIGKNTVIGAGSIVTRSIPDYVVAVGNPARVIKKLDEFNK